MTEEQKLAVMRAIDKLDRLGADAVRDLLTTGRRDESGAFHAGAGLSEERADMLLFALTAAPGSSEETLARLDRWYRINTMPDDELFALEEALAKEGIALQV